MNMIKYFDLHHLLEGAALSVTYYTFSVLRMLKTTRRIDPPKQILLAHIWVLRNLRKIISKRIRMNMKATVPKHEIFRNDFFATIPEMIHEYRIIAGVSG